jgi:glycosyltransferase involved in cell wall biosynthesis
MENLTLCMFAPEFFPVWGGTGSYIIELIKSLPKNVSIHVITLKRDIPRLSHGTDPSDSSVSEILNRNIQTHYVSTSKETFFYNLPFQIACLRRFPSLHRKFHFDIAHSHLCHMPDVFLKLLSRNNVPTVLTVHGTIQMLREHALVARSLFGGLESSENSILRFYPLIKLLQQNYVKHVSRFIAVSKATAEYALKHLDLEEEAINVVYNGVDTEVFGFPTKKQIEKKYSNPTVVYVGRLIAKKGINVLIKAIPEVLRRFPETLFIFVGGGNITHYRELLTRMQIPGKNFLFTGHLGYFERVRILQESTVFVNPSFFENCSISILEAMSCGNAVIACNVGGNPELIQSENNGLLVPAFNNKRLADSIIFLLENEKFNRDMSENARETVEQKFSLKDFGEKTYRVYRQALNLR